jgi:hypothetical protein
MEVREGEIIQFADFAFRFLSARQLHAELQSYIVASIGRSPGAEAE